jgi:hypothetical protein
MPRFGFSPSRVAPVGASSRRYLPLSQPPASGDHGSRPIPESRAARHDLVLDAADQEAVLRLQRHRRDEPVGVRDGDRFRELPAEVVREAVVADLARGHRVVEEAQRLLQRRQIIPGVHLV